jgi:Protein of unknown function (DUF2933)
MQHEPPHPEAPNLLRPLSRYVFFGFVIVAAFFLITEHRAHLFGWLPFLLLAACPLMHFFHHRGHGSGGKHGPPGSTPRSEPPPTSGGAEHHH